MLRWTHRCTRPGRLRRAREETGVERVGGPFLSYTGTFLIIAMYMHVYACVCVCMCMYTCMRSIYNSHTCMYTTLYTWCLYNTIYKCIRHIYIYTSPPLHPQHHPLRARRALKGWCCGWRRGGGRGTSRKCGEAGSNPDGAHFENFRNAIFKIIVE